MAAVPGRHHRFAPGALAALDQALGPALWGVDAEAPSLDQLDRAVAAAGGDELLGQALQWLRDLDLEGFQRRGFVRKARSFRDVFLYPEPVTFPIVEPEQATGRVRFARGAALPEGLSLYTDVPFCEQACRFCTTIGRNTRGDREPVRGYLDHLEREARLLASRFDGGIPHFTSLYIGGGTGSYLTHDEIDRLMGILDKELGFTPAVRKMMEGNPVSVPRDKVEHLLALGFDALSLGVETFEPHLLEGAKRAHDAALAEERIRGAIDAGMGHTNIDIMLGLPEQTVGDFCRTMETIGRVRPGAVSLFQLRLHEKTGFWNLHDSRFPAINAVYFMQALARAYLADAGYVRTEGNRYALDPAYLHPQHLHTRRGYGILSLGTRAMSQVGTLAWANTNVTLEYQGYIARGHLAARRMLDVDEWTMMHKAIVLPLKLPQGVERKEFARRFGRDLDDVFAEPLAELVDLGLLERDAAGYRFTERGVLLETEALRRFLAWKPAALRTSERPVTRLAVAT